ncbi:MAG: hypothetical protein FWC19_07800 [Treponema sp.]|nr:hypothetical protein [Treponema sp.]MCL2272685.1 hypothetical protein [Treponema sp.]
MRNGFAAVLFGLLFFNCVSYLSAANYNPTVVVGTIVNNSTGYPFCNCGNMSVNGINKHGIKITIQEKSSKKIFTLVSESDGLFFSVNIPKGIYTLDKIYLKKTYNTCWYEVSWSCGICAFEVLDGKVNNLGTIKWNCEHKKRSHISYNMGYEEAMNIFMTRYSSICREREWINTNIKHRD